MSINKHLPHLLVIPEDDANRQIMEGFRNHLSIAPRKIHVENVAGGWQKALESFQDEHAPLMRKYDKRQVLIMIDFDEVGNRLARAKEYIPEDLRDRVFVLGSSSNPEKLSSALKLKKEEVGTELAQACVTDSGEIWDNPLLSHNQSELARMKSGICSNLLNE